MPCSLSSPLAPKRWQLMKHSTAVLLIILLFAAGSCGARARGLGVRGNGHSSSRAHLLPGSKDVAASSLKAGGWLTRQMEATTSSTVHSPIDDDHMAHQAGAKAKAKAKEGMSMASSSAGAVRATPAVRVSQRLSRREDTGFHLDYAGPRTHTPSHN
ncbi:hypothetical protein BS78_06G184300 [Paspalum vaginatum]|nr:hypothetical protein BS78_06G184300 [Paspalum vaginatum]